MLDPVHDRRGMDVQRCVRLPIRRPNHSRHHVFRHRFVFFRRRICSRWSDRVAQLVTGQLATLVGGT